MSRAWIENIAVFIIAGAAVLAIRAFAKSGHDKLAGTLTMLPVLTATSIAFLLIDSRPAQVRSVLISSLMAVPAVATFVAALWLSLKHTHWTLAFVAAFAAWATAAAGMIWLRGRLGF